MRPPTPEPGQALALTRRLALCPDPVQLYTEVLRDGATPGTILLETAEVPGRPAGQGGKSLVVAHSALRISSRAGRVTARARGDNGAGLLPWLEQAVGHPCVARDADSRTWQLGAQRSSAEEERLKAPSPMDVARAVLRLRERSGQQVPLLVGGFAYDLLDQFERLPPAPQDPLGWPDMELWLPDRLVWLDHEHRSATAVAFLYGGGADPSRAYGEATAAIVDLAQVVERCAAHVAAATATDPSPGGPRPVRVDTATATDPSPGGPRPERVDTATATDPGPGGPRPVRVDTATATDPGPCGPRRAAGTPAGAETVAVDLDDAAYAALVRRLKQNIVAGDLFQIVPSRSFSVPCPDPLAAYRELRRLNPSPYMYYLVGDHGVLLGSSPETAVRVDGETRKVHIRPIAGTRPRGRTAEGQLDLDLDNRLEADLRLDEKELAEHMMLVDLARNDVARVSEPGTRTVERLLHVERYSHVMHLVSHVTGTLRADLDPLHAYVATMNMGTLTGAPKVRAAELLRRSEVTRRGPYGGAVGHINASGDLDSAIVIRSAVVQNGVAHVRAGAGVVYDSDPDAEAQETSRKARAVIEAIRRAHEEG